MLGAAVPRSALTEASGLLALLALLPPSLALPDFDLGDPPGSQSLRLRLLQRWTFFDPLPRPTLSAVAV